MSKLNTILLTAFLLVCGVTGGAGRAAHAQVNVRVLILAPASMPKDVRAWIDNPALIQITVQNTTQTAYDHLAFSFQVNGATRGRVVSSKDLHPAQPRFSLGPLETRLFTARDLIDEEALAFASGIEAEVARDGVPEDHYAFCATVVNASAQPMGNTGGLCTPFTIIEPDPPTLVHPVGAEVEARTLRFQWTPVARAGVQYRLVVKPRFQGQDPVTALQGNPVLFEQTLSVPAYTYLPSDPSFDLYPHSVGFVWQVQSLQDQRPVGKQDGRSTVGTFTMRAVQPPVAQAAPTPLAPLGAGASETVRFRVRPPAGGAFATGGSDPFAPAGGGTRSGGWSDYTRPMDLPRIRLQVWRLQSADEDPAGAKRRPAEWGGAVDQRTMFDGFLQGDFGRVLAFRGEYGVSYVWTVEATASRPSGGAYERLWVTDDAVFTVGQARGVLAAGANADPAAWKPQAEGACGAGCTVPKPAETELFSGEAADLSGANVQVGAFVMKVHDVEGEAGSLSGTGVVHVPFLRASLRVTFDDLAVNKEGQVVGGTVHAVADGDVIPAEWLQDFAGPFQGGDRSVVQQVQDYVAAGRRVSGVLQGETPMGLPVGLGGGAVGPGGLAVNVVGVRFTAEGAKANVAMTFPVPLLGGTLALGSKNICLLPGGFAQSEVEIGLIADYTFDVGGVKTTLFDTEQEGTSARANCDGFQRLRVSMEQEYPRSWLVSVDGRGEAQSDPVKAQFQGVFTSTRGWILNGTLRRAGLAAAPGFWFDAPTVFLDWSAAANHAGMKYPDGFQGDRSDGWTGLYVPEATLHLPRPFRATSGSGRDGLKASVQGLLVDRSGVSIYADLRNVVSLSGDQGGDLDGWTYSLDRFRLRLVSNAFKTGEMDGGVKLPWVDAPLVYKGKFGYWGSALLAQMEVQNRSAIRSSLLGANVTIDPSSAVAVFAGRDGFVGSATLHGALAIGQIPGTPLTASGLKFRNVQLTTDPAQPIADVGVWDASVQADFFSLPGNVRRPRFVTQRMGDGCNTKAGLEFDLDVSMQPRSLFNAGTTVGVYGLLSCGQGSGPMQGRFWGVDVRRLRLAGDLGLFRIGDSYVDFFKDDATFGNGARGGVTVLFGQNSISGYGQFGKVRGMDYASVDLLYRSEIPIGFLGPVSIHGVGGGFSYNLRRDTSLPKAADLARRGGSDTSYRPRYTPSYGTRSFRLASTLGVMGVTAAMNADAVIEMEFGSSWNLQRVNLDGRFYALGPGLSARENAAFNGTLDASYDVPGNQIWGAVRASTGDFFRKVGVTADAWLMLYAGPSSWYFRLGDPTYRARIRVFNFDLDAYAMMGTSIPDVPAPPGGVRTRPRREWNASYMTSPGGFVFGASTGFRASGAFAGVEASLDARAGFDFGLYNWGPTAYVRTANGAYYKPIGANGWYGTGQLYAYLSGKIYADVWGRRVQLAEASATAVLDGGFPRPAWARGTIYGSWSVLNGSGSGKIAHEITVGSPGYPNY